MKAGVKIDEIPTDKVMLTLEKYQPIPFKEQIAEAAKKEVTNVISRIPDQISEDIHQKLSLKNKTETILLDIILDRINDIPIKVRNRLINNSIISKAVNRDELD